MNLSSELHGYWHCSFCVDTVTIRKPYGRWDRKVGEECPNCHNQTANWMADVPPPAPPEIPKQKPVGLVKVVLPPEKIEVLFDKMRGAVK